MADLLEQIRQQLSARMAELRPLVEEHRRLASALQALGVPKGEPPGPPPASSSAQTRSRALALARRRRLSRVSGRLAAPIGTP